MVAKPEQELRFTRSRQGRDFFLIGSVLVSVAVTLFATAATAWFGGTPPLGIWWSFLPLFLSIPCFWLAYHCTHKAFLILSPVGIELFPLYKPIQNFQLWPWADIALAEFKDQQLYLHFNQEQTAGAIISLAPMLPSFRALLAKAIQGRMAERAAQTP